MAHQYRERERNRGARGCLRTLQAASWTAWDVCATAADAVAGLVGGLFAAREEISVKGRRFAVVRRLGEGGFAFVFLVSEATPGGPELYALKRVRVQLAEHEARLRAEVRIHERLRAHAAPHLHVVRLVDADIVRGSHLVSAPASALELPLLAEGRLLLPYYDQGSLQDLIDSATSPLPLQRILLIATAIADGLLSFQFVHLPCLSDANKTNMPTNYSPFSNLSPPLAFRDLKPANVLLCPKHTAVLIDLGSVAPARVSLSSRRDAIALQELCAET
ncbi:Serine/threonine-protein kinase 16, partial [Physocladia obscura]